MQVIPDQFHPSRALFDVSRWLLRLRGGLFQNTRTLDINYNDASRYVPRLVAMLGDWLKPTNHLRLIHIWKPTEFSITGPATLFVFQAEEIQECRITPGQVITISDGDRFDVTPDMLNSAVLGLAWRYLAPDPMIVIAG